MHMMKAQYDKHMKAPIKYQTRDMVWLSVTQVSSRSSKKLDHKYLGPYKVVKKVGTSAYQLTTQWQSTKHMMFNEQLLKPVR